MSALVTIELGDLEAAEICLRDAGALNAATENAYDTHPRERRARAVLPRAAAAAARPSSTPWRRVTRRRRWRSCAFHFYAMAIEAAARVDLGEMHAATLVATTALGAVENLQGCEYGLEIRSLCADALKRAGSPQAPSAHQRAVDYAQRPARTTCATRGCSKLFTQRPMNAALFETTPVPSVAVERPKRPSAPPSAASPGAPETA